MAVLLEIVIKPSPTIGTQIVGESVRMEGMMASLTADCPRHPFGVISTHRRP